MAAEKQLVIYNNLLGNLFFNLNNNQLNNFHFEDNTNCLNNIYYAQITEYSKSLDIFFLDLGNNQTAILKEDNTTSKLTLGQKIIVQIIKEGSSSKQPTATICIKLAGFYLVYLPRNFSSQEDFTETKIKSANTLDSAMLNGLISQIEPNLNLEQETLIIRSIVNTRNIEGLLIELSLKQQLWQHISNLSGNKLGLLYQTPTILNLLYAANSNIPKEILCNNTELLLTIKQQINSQLPFLNIECIKETNYKTYTNSLTTAIELFGNTFNINSNIELIIENTAAFTVIDVNFKGNVNYTKEDALLVANLSIINKLAEIIKLKDLSGQILIDLLKLKQKENRDTLFNKFRSALEASDSNIKVLGLTRLGILEVVRKKSQASLNQKILTSCPICNGSGETINQNFLYFKTIFFIDNILYQNPLAKINLKANSAFLEQFKLNYQAYLANIVQQNNCTLNFITDPNLKNDIIVY